MQSLPQDFFPLGHVQLPSWHTLPAVQLMFSHKSIAGCCSVTASTDGWYSDVGIVRTCGWQATKKIRNVIKKYLAPI
jgi:hypothetical protein